MPRHLRRRVGSQENQTRFGVSFMATGLLVNGICFETAILAQDAYFSSQSVLLFSGNFSLRYEQQNGVWHKIVERIQNNGTFSLVSDTVALVPVFPVCMAPSEQYLDGMTFGFLLVSVMLIPWILSMLKKALI